MADYSAIHIFFQQTFVNLRKSEVNMNIYKIGDTVVYGAEGLCKIDDITEKTFGKETFQYYVLKQIGKEDSVTFVPINNERSLSKMRHILTKDAFEEIISEMPNGATDWIVNDRERQKAFKDIILFGDTKDIIKLIRTLYAREKEQVEKGKKLHIADERIFKDAEKIINEEIAYVFDIPKENVIEFIAQKLSK